MLIGFQKFRWSTQSEVEFTLNLAVAFKDAWAEARSKSERLPARPSPNVHYEAPIWQSRISGVLGETGDRIWLVRAGWPTAAVAGDVLDVIESAALPAMRQKLAELRAR
jgi:hypothetical protein